MTRIVTRSALGRNIFQKEHILALMLAHVPENDHVRVEVTPRAPDNLQLSCGQGGGEDEDFRSSLLHVQKGGSTAKTKGR